MNLMTISQPRVPYSLHTKSAYAEEMNTDITMPQRSEQNLGAQIAYCQSKEQAAYQAIFPNCKTFSQFLSELRKIFKDSSQDSFTFRFFENQKIRSALNQWYNKTKNYIQPVDLSISIEVNDPTVQLNLPADMVQSNGNKITLTFKTSESVKLFANQYFPKLINEKSHGFITSNAAMTTVGHYIIDNADKVIANNSNIIAFDTTGMNQVFNYRFKLNRPNPFNYTKKDLEQVMNDPIGQADLKRDLLDAKEEIKTFMIVSSNLQKASVEMQTAFQTTWNRNVESRLMDLGLFMKGGAINYLIGAFGEFQSALLIEYLREKVGNSNPTLQAIISDTLKSEQSKVDTTAQIQTDKGLFEKLGIQVKNYNIYNPNSKKQLETTQYMGTFLSRVAETSNGDTLTLGEFFANYFFNQTYQDSQGASFETARKTLSQFFGEMANLAISESFDDTVSFYFIGGSLIVPASAILLNISKKQEKGRDNLTIKGPATVSDDDGFKKEGLLHKYWLRSQHTWYPRQENRRLYNNLLNRSITVHSSFSFNDFLNGDFSLFST